VRPVFRVGHAYMANEFRKHNPAAVRAGFARAFSGVPLKFEPHAEFKKRVPAAIGLIRTGDTVQYANLILVSG
jgi:D-ribose pyranase